MAKPKFTIFSMLLTLAVVGLGLALILSNRERNRLGKELARAETFQQYLKDELGYIENDDETQFCLRELENQVPLARRYLVDFPHGQYYVVAGNFIGGDFKPENLQPHSRSKTFFRMRTRMTIHVYRNPKGEPEFSVDTVDFSSGQSGGGSLQHHVNVNRLNYVDDQHGQAITWRIANDRPHGEVQYYPAGTSFIPLFILKKGISLEDEQGNPLPTQGLAFWIEPKPKK